MGKTLANVAKCVVTNERTGRNFDIGETASDIDVEPILSQGKRDILRVKNKIYGVNETEDIVIGYKLKLKDNVFNLDVMQLVDGGTLNGNHYESIPAGEVVTKDLFTLTVYSEEKDYNVTTGYTVFKWKHCKGKVPKWKIKDGDFVVPEFEAESIPFRGEKPVDIDSVKTLPITTNPMTGVVGNTVTSNNSDVAVSVTINIKWTYTNAINPDDVTTTHFVITKKSTGAVVAGTLTIDDTHKIVTFVPTGVEANTTYTVTATAVDLLDASGTTTPITVDFTTI
jgi:hypothetical protein